MKNPDDPTPTDGPRAHSVGGSTPHNHTVEPWNCLGCNPNGWPMQRWLDNEATRQSYNDETRRARPPTDPADRLPLVDVLPPGASGWIQGVGWVTILGGGTENSGRLPQTYTKVAALDPQPVDRPCTVLKGATCHNPACIDERTERGGKTECHAFEPGGNLLVSIPFEPLVERVGTKPAERNVSPVRVDATIETDDGGVYRLAYERPSPESPSEIEHDLVLLGQLIAAGETQINVNIELAPQRDGRGVQAIAPTILPETYAEALGILLELVEHEDQLCSFDHHGHCQEHRWFGEDVCVTRRARLLLAAHGCIDQGAANAH